MHNYEIIYELWSKPLVYPLFKSHDIVKYVVVLFMKNWSHLSLMGRQVYKKDRDSLVIYYIYLGARVFHDCVIILINFHCQWLFI